MQAHAGPFFYESGTLNKPQRDEIYEKTGCSAAIRVRNTWQGRRGLTIAGPPAQMEQARAMADEFIRASVDGAKGVAEKPNTRATAKRRAFAERTKKMVESFRKGWGADKGECGQDSFAEAPAYGSFAEARPAYGYSAEARPAEGNDGWEWERQQPSPPPSSSTIPRPPPLPSPPQGAETSTIVGADASTIVGGVAVEEEGAAGSADADTAHANANVIKALPCSQSSAEKSAAAMRLLLTPSGLCERFIKRLRDQPLWDRVSLVPCRKVLVSTPFTGTDEWPTSLLEKVVRFRNRVYRLLALRGEYVESS